MRFGFFSFRADWKLARRISWDSWNIRNNAYVPEKLNNTLAKIARKAFTPTGVNRDSVLRQCRQEVAKNSKLLDQAIYRYKRDFLCLEEIKYNASILESGRIRHLNEFERILGELERHMHIDVPTAKRMREEIHQIRTKLSSGLSDDKEMARRLKGKV
jgi:hypothetical protein